MFVVYNNMLILPTDDTEELELGGLWCAVCIHVIGWIIGW
jgi:hypothetical protein